MSCPSPATDATFPDMISRLIGLFLVLVTSVSLSAQSQLSGDGRQAVEKSGIALVKPQKWSKPNEAVPVRFTAYTNRGGYFVFRTPSGQERQVWVDQIVGSKPILEPVIPSEILDAAQRNDLQNQVVELKRLAAQSPSAAIELGQYAKPFIEALQRYDAGEVRVNGIWELASKYRASQFYDAQVVLQKSIEQEVDKSQFDLEENSNFKQLIELSKNDASLGAKVQAIRDDFQKKALSERQHKIIDQLTNPHTTESEAQALIQELESFKNPDEKTKAVLQQAVTAGLLDQEILKIKTALEAHFAAQTPSETPPKLPINLELETQILAGQISTFRMTSPPVGIRISDATARAIAEVSGGLPKTTSLFDQRKYVEAATLLTNLNAQAANIGPATQRVILALQVAATKKVDLFSKLRAEGDKEEKAGNIPAALEKYNAALEISPNSDLSAKIEQLKTPAKK